MDGLEALKAEVADLKLRNRVLMGMLGIKRGDRELRNRLCGALNVSLRSKKTLNHLLLLYDTYLTHREW